MEKSFNNIANEYFAFSCVCKTKCTLFILATKVDLKLNDLIRNLLVNNL